MNQTNRNQPGRFFEENYRLAAEQEGLFALDTYSDNLCLLRCMAVHQGSYPNRCTEKAKQLAGKFYFNDESHRPEAYQKITLDELKKVEETFKLAFVCMSSVRTAFCGLQGSRLTMTP